MTANLEMYFGYGKVEVLQTVEIASFFGKDTFSFSAPLPEQIHKNESIGGIE